MTSIEYRAKSVEDNPPQSPLSLRGDEGGLRDLPQKTLFRPDEVAEFFDVAKSTVYRWIENGNLLYCRPSNGTIRIFRESIIKLLNKN